MELKPGADKLSFNKTTGVYKLIGNIHLLYQRNEMYCDSAFYNKQNSLLKLYGNVHLSKNDTLNLYCDSMHYNGMNQEGKLWGHVRVRDREYKLTTDTLIYFSKQDLAFYHYGGKIENTAKKEIITSTKGYFNPKRKNIAFSQSVHYKSDQFTLYTDTIRFDYGSKRIYFLSPTDIHQQNKTVIHCEKGWMNTSSEECLIYKNASISKPHQTLRADTLYSYESKGLSSAHGHIQYTDSDKGISFEGNKLYSSKKNKKSYLTNKAFISYKLKEDTLFIAADTLFLFHDSLDEIEKVKGYHNGKIYSKKLQGSSDSLEYIKKTQLLYLYKSPILWNENAQISGNTMNLLLKDSLIQKAEIKERAITITEVSKKEYYNQVGGKNMVVYFDSINDLKKIDVLGNSQTIYYPEETKEKDTVIEITRKGMVRLYSSMIKIYLENGEFKKVTYADQADGLMYPLDKINSEEQFIANFQWSPNLRPTSFADLHPISPKAKKATVISKPNKSKKKK
jgi:lipopolysaccharide export system protein LptA